MNHYMLLEPKKKEEARKSNQLPKHQFQEKQLEQQSTSKSSVENRNIQFEAAPSMVNTPPEKKISSQQNFKACCKNIKHAPSEAISSTSRFDGHKVVRRNKTRSNAI